MPSSHSIHLSIIMPVYNKADYVARCLHSILDQDYTDYELVIVNDGSTDSSADIIKTFIDPRIRLFTTINQGVSAARNRGMAEARGEYLMFVDADDYISTIILTILCSRQNPMRQICMCGASPKISLMAVKYP